MRLRNLVDRVIEKKNFSDLEGYINFCVDYLIYIADNLQATIVSRNENHYCFYQYNKEGGFQVTRPINSELMYDADEFPQIAKELLGILQLSKTIDKNDADVRAIINKATYTIQQSIGAALDGLSVGMSNKARKINGDLFERLIRLIISEMGIGCRAGIVKIPVIIDGEEAFSMNYQHDLIIERDEVVQVIGSVKTSSKDRIDKIFIDKSLHNKLLEADTPHIAVFLNDVQRKKTKQENQFGVNSTFLPGHFKGYTIKLNPLDGVYYCDIRPTMLTEDILKDHIKTFDKLLIDDIWEFLK